MTTEQEKAVARGLGYDTQYLGQIPIDHVIESKENPRKTFDEMDELAASIGRQGVLSPILVRSAGADQHYLLISGARRLRAAKAAGLTEIPATIVIGCTDEAASEIRIVENAQRRDVHPMEEAEAYELLVARLRKDHEDPVAEAALRVGKSRSHVQRRLVLTALPKSGRELYRAGKIALEVAVAIARIPNGKFREEAAKRIDGGRYGDCFSTEESLLMIRNNYMLELGSAPFDTKDPLLVKAAGACGDCPKRTGNQVDLFGDVAGDLCTDSVCHKSKADAAWSKRAAAARANGQRVLTQEEAKKVYPHGSSNHCYDDRFVDPDEKEYSLLGGKSWKQVVKAGDRPDPILVRTPDGGIKELWDAHAAKTLAKASPVLAKKVHGQESSKAKARAEKKKAKLEKRAILLAAEAILDPGLTDALGETDFLRSVLPVMISHARGYEFGKILAKRHGHRSVKAMLEAYPAAGLRAVLLETFLGTLGDWRRPEAVPKFADALGLEMTDFRKRASSPDAEVQT